DEVQGHLYVQGVVSLYALEVSVDQTGFGRVTLQILDDYAFSGAVDFQRDDRREERFVVESVQQLVVSDRDVGWRFVATVDDGRHQVFLSAQAAARTFPYVGSRLSFEHKFMLGHGC